jgi:hypothetical protein
VPQENIRSVRNKMAGEGSDEELRSLYPGPRIISTCGSSEEN